MGRKLTTYVHAVELDATGGTVQSGVFGPGDAVPDWARAAITNPDVWEVEHGTQEVPVVQRDEGDLIPAVPLKVEAEQVLERPRGNASRDAWVAYATSRDIEIEDDMGRDDIVAAVQLADEE